MFVLLFQAERENAQALHHKKLAYMFMMADKFEIWRAS